MLFDLFYATLNLAKSLKPSQPPYPTPPRTLRQDSIETENTAVGTDEPPGKLYIITSNVVMADVLNLI